MGCKEVGAQSAGAGCRRAAAAAQVRVVSAGSGVVIGPWLVRAEVEIFSSLLTACGVPVTCICRTRSCHSRRAIMP